MNYVTIPAPKGLETIFPDGVMIREDIANDPEAVAQAIVKLGAQVRPQTPVQDVAGEINRGLTSTVRGAAELTGLKEKDLGAEMESRIIREQNAGAAAARLGGEVFDPVWFSKFGKVFDGLGTVGKTAAEVGTGAAISGFLQPVYDELGDSRLANTLTAGIAGVGLGGLIGKVAQKFGYKDAEELADKVDEMSEAERKEITDAIADEARADAAEVAADVKPSVSTDTASRFKNVTFKEPEETAFAQVLRKQAERREAEQAAAKSDYELKARKYIASMEDQVAQLPKLGVRKAETDDVLKRETKYQEKLGPALKKERERRAQVRSSKMSRKQQASAVKVIDNRIADLEAKLDGSAKKIAEAKQKKEYYDDVTNMRNELNDWYNNQTVLPKRVVEDIGEAPQFKVNKPAEAPKEPTVEAKAEPIVPQQPRPDQPVETPLQALQQPKFTGESVGAGRQNILTEPTSAAEAATLDLRTKAARDLPEVSPSVAKSRPEMTPREAKQQAYMDKMDDDIFNADGVEGKLTFKAMLEAAEDKQRVVEMEIDEGNYKDAADWLAREFENSEGIMSPANKIVASRIYAIASDNLVKLQDAFRQIEKNGTVSNRMVEMLGEMQEDAQLRNAMDVMRNIERIEKQDKKNTSAALNSFKLANKMKKAQMQQLARARTISKLYFGVEC